MKLLVVIPTYNEKENISTIIANVSEYAPHASILVVDDTSPDGTGDIVRDLQQRASHLHLMTRINKNGLGRAYIDAFKHIFENFDPEAVAMMDADHSHDPKYLRQMEMLLADADVVVGSRYVAGGGTVGWEPWRKALSSYGNAYARMITGIPVRDLTGGFYVIRTDALRSIDLDRIDSSGYAFQIELKSAFHKKGLIIKEHPIVFGNRIGGESKISNHIISEGLIAPWKIRFRKLGQ